MINLQYFIDRNIFYTLLYDVLWFSHTIFGENSARVKLKKTNLNTSVIGLLLCYDWLKFRFFLKKLHSNLDSDWCVQNRVHLKVIK